jgi:glyceraldehyde-3-phosphate dehydrogenase (NAD(P))
MVTRNGFSPFGATAAHADAMRAAGLNVKGTLDELLGQADVVWTAARTKCSTRSARRHESH